MRMKLSIHFTWSFLDCSHGVHGTCSSNIGNMHQIWYKVLIQETQNMVARKSNQRKLKKKKKQHSNKQRTCVHSNEHRGSHCVCKLLQALNYRIRAYSTQQLEPTAKVLVAQRPGHGHALWVPTCVINTRMRCMHIWCIICMPICIVCKWWQLHFWPWTGDTG